MPIHTSDHDLIITGIHLDLTPAIKQNVKEKVDRLFRHEDRIIRVKVDLECVHVEGSKDYRFIAKGLIDINGPSLVVSVEEPDCYKAIDEMIDKLDRMLRRRSRLKKVKRKDTHQIEIPADLPKMS